MFIDTLLQFIGEDPGAYSQAGDKWIVLWVRIIIFAVPLYLFFLLLAPFLFLWWKKKRFSLRNIVLAFLVSVALVGVGLFSLIVAFYLLQGAAFVDLYSS